MRKTAETNRSKFVTLLTFAIVFAALYIAQDVFIPIALALLLMFVLSPVADWLERWKLPRGVAAACVVVVLCMITLGIGWVVGDQLVRFANDLPQYRDEIAGKMRVVQDLGSGLNKRLGSFEELKQTTTDAGATTGPTTAVANPVVDPQAREQIRETLATADQPEIAPTTRPATRGASAETPVFVRDVATVSSPLGNLAIYAGYVLSPLGTAGIVLVLLLFLLIEREQLRDRFIRLISSGRYTVTTQALGDATSRIGRYLRAQLIVNGTYGIAVSIGLWAIGATLGKEGTAFPSFVLWGVLCAVLRFIPYVGPWVAAAFPIAVSLAVYEGFVVFAATASMFIIIELISNNVMEPLLYGSSTGLSTVALLIAAVVWTWLWGPVGLFLSTPMTVCLVVLGKYVPPLKFLDVMLGDEPALPPGVRFYQRVLASHEPEAESVAREIRKERGQLAEVGDSAIIPALRLARVDRRLDELTADAERKFYDRVRKVVSHVFGSEKEENAEEVDASDAPAERPLLLGVPVHHRSELLILQMLSEMVGTAEGRVEALPISFLPWDIESQIESSKPAAVFIAVLPPGGMSQARTLCRRLRKQFKDLKIIVGYFGTFRDLDRLQMRFRASGANQVATSLSQSFALVAEALDLEVPPSTERAEPPRRSIPASSGKPL